jgi:DNA-binding NarL/FixJ family response regulator
MKANGTVESRGSRAESQRLAGTLAPPGQWGTSNVQRPTSNFDPGACREIVEELPPSLKLVLRHMADGLATKQIAAECDLSESTVQVYRERIYSRLRVNNLAAATRVAVAAGLV